jgi:hypothetical protein
VGLHSTALAQSWNFFAFNLSNHLPPSTGIAGVLAKKFEQASQCAAQVGVSDMARYAQDGTEAAAPKQPFKLLMVRLRRRPAVTHTQRTHVRARAHRSHLVRSSKRLRQKP